MPLMNKHGFSPLRCVRMVRLSVSTGESSGSLTMMKCPLPIDHSGQRNRKWVDGTWPRLERVNIWGRVVNAYSWLGSTTDKVVFLLTPLAIFNIESVKLSECLGNVMEANGFQIVSRYLLLPMPYFQTWLGSCFCFCFLVSRSTHIAFTPLYYIYKCTIILLHIIKLYIVIIILANYY